MLLRCCAVGFRRPGDSIGGIPLWQGQNREPVSAADLLPGQLADHGCCCCSADAAAPGAAAAAGTDDKAENQGQPLPRPAQPFAPCLEMIFACVLPHFPLEHTHASAVLRSTLL